jgi:signal transduction histidine kinase
MVGTTTKELNIYAESGSRDSILRQLRQQGHVRDVDVTLRTHGGDILNCIFSAEIIEMNGRKVLLISVADITERKQAEATLHNAHRELERLVRERTSQLRALAERLTRVEQEERRRISQILHEDLQQMLVGAKYRLSGLMKHNAEQSVQSAVEAVAGILDQAIQVTRTIGMDLRPPVLHESGLGAALLWLADDMRHKFGLTVEIQADPAAEPASENLRVLTFQAVRELLFNVSKHAGVKDAQVQTSVDADSIRVVVKDRGSGFDVTVRRPADLGLFSIRERMEFVSGQMQVASAPGQGTCVTLTLPLR